MCAMPLDTGTLHFVGIGGIGMSGIAEILKSLEYDIQGSDLSDSANVKRLREQGISVSIGHDGENILNADGEEPAALVISSAVKDDNPEVIEARARKIPVVRRAEMLAEIMRLKSCIAVGGTHGKTTTTSMVGEMLITAGVDPTIVNGGIVNKLGTNVCLGEGDWFVAEADESDGTFTRLPAEVAVITNIDPEHLDHYGSFDNAKLAFRRFVENIPFYGFAVLCIDHPEVQTLISTITDRKVIAYGMSPQADVRAYNIRTDKGESIFNVRFAGWLSEDGQEFEMKDVRLSMLGRHNVQNSLVALTIAQQMNVPQALMKDALANFQGVKRRFTKTGEVNGVSIIDDYAHHPVEIDVVLKTARSAVRETGGRVIAIMQPHRYTRLQDLFDDFSASFNDADSVIISDVYEAGETPIDGVHKDSLVEAIRARGHKDVTALSSESELAEIVASKAQAGDYVVCLGAGSITAWAYALPDQLAALQDKSQESAA